VKDLFLDYQILDHLLRCDEGRYSGLAGAALNSLRNKAMSQELSVWMSEIAQVEMVHGIKNPRINKETREKAERNDHCKLAIATSMHVRWLSYPCSTTDDEYSLCDLSFRCGGPEWSEAYALQRNFEQTPGISKGDARHLVSWVFGYQIDRLDYRPTIDSFVSEDEPLRRALLRLKAEDSIPVLATVQVLSVEELIRKISGRG